MLQFSIVKNNINFETKIQKFCFEAIGRKELTGTNHFFSYFQNVAPILFLQKLKFIQGVNCFIFVLS